MLKLLTAIFEFFTRAYDMWRDAKLRNEGRQEANQEAQANADHNEAVAVAVDSSVDVARDDRLRNRFDRSRAKPPVG